MAIPSLALIPTGFKDGKLYSVLPESGAGDFDVVRGSGATRVNKDGLIESMVNNEPRLDYTDGGCPSLLLEPQSINLFRYSEDFSQWADIGTLTKTGNYSLSPSGENNATRLQWASGTNFTFLNTSHVGNDFTLSIYLKSNTSVSQNVKLFMDNGSKSQDVVVTTQWKRFEFTNITPTTQSGRNTGLISSSSQVGGLDISIWGAQFEALPYSTSYIPTEGAIATRLADSVTGAGDATTFSSTEGVLYAEIAALSDDLTFRSITLSDGTFDNRVTIRYRTTSNQISAIVEGNNVVSFNNNFTSSDITALTKIALKYKSGDIALWVNGVEVLTSTSSFTAIGLNNLSLNNGIGGDSFYGKVKDLRVFNTALADSRLLTLTTL